MTTPGEKLYLKDFRDYPSCDSYMISPGGLVYSKISNRIIKPGRVGKSLRASITTSEGLKSIDIKKMVSETFDGALPIEHIPQGDRPTGAGRKRTYKEKELDPYPFTEKDLARIDLLLKCRYPPADIARNLKFPDIHIEYLFRKRKKDK